LYDLTLVRVGLWYWYDLTRVRLGKVRLDIGTTGLETFHSYLGLTFSGLVSQWPVYRSFSNCNVPQTKKNQIY